MEESKENLKKRLRRDSGIDFLKNMVDVLGKSQHKDDTFVCECAIDILKEKMGDDRFNDYRNYILNIDGKI